VPPRCCEYKPGEFLTARPLKLDEKINKDEYDENWAYPRVLSGGSSCLADSNGPDDSEDEEDMYGSVKRTGKEKVRNNGKGKGKATDNGN